MLIVNLVLVLFTIFQICMILTCFLGGQIQTMCTGGCNKLSVSFQWLLVFGLLPSPNRKDLNWPHFINKPRVQEKQQVKDQQSCIFVFVACLTIPNSNKGHQPPAPAKAKKSATGEFFLIFALRF